MSESAVLLPAGVELTVTAQASSERVPVPSSGASVTVSYVGRIVDSTDSGVAWGEFDRNDAFTFRIGSQHVIDGWEVALPHLHVGDHATLRLRPDFAYGAEGLPNPHGPPKVPPNATLTFDLVVLAVAALSAAELAAGEHAGLLEDSAAASGGDAHMRLGESSAMDELGPMVLQSNGHYKRIANWSSMMPEEQARTRRVVAKRNAKRLAKLKASISSAAESSGGVK